MDTLQYYIHYSAIIWGGQILCFCKKSFTLRLHLFDQKYSKNSKILLQFKITVFYLNIF